MHVTGCREETDMKKMRKMAVVIISLMLIVMMAAGCGSKKPTAEDAKAYVQATMDLMCTGDYDHSVELSDIEEGQETATRDKMIDDALIELTGSIGLDDEASAQFKDFMIKALGMAKYTVTDAVETEDGGFDVTVSVEPLKIYEGATDEFLNKMPDNLGHSYAELAAMTEEERNNVIYKALFAFLTERLDDPVYGEAEDVVVHYGILDEEQNVYGCTSSEGQKLGEKLFSVDGI